MLPVRQMLTLRTQSYRCPTGLGIGSELILPFPEAQPDPEYLCILKGLSHCLVASIVYRNTTLRGLLKECCRVGTANLEFTSSEATQLPSISLLRSSRGTLSRFCAWKALW